MIILPGETHSVGAAKYLNVFSANRAFAVSSKDEGLSKTTVKAGFSYDLEKYSMITFHNDGADNLDIDFEMSSLRVVVGSNAGVEILNAPTIEKINQPIAVTAQATVENGTVHIVPGTSINDAVDKPINAGAKVQLLAANPNRKSVLVQVISATRTDLRIGSSSVAAGRGVYVAGSKAAPGVMPIELTGAIYAFNESDEPALLTVTEVVK